MAIDEEVDSAKLAAYLLLEEFSLPDASKRDLKNRLIKYKNHGKSSAVKQLEFHLSDVKCWPRGKAYLEKHSIYKDEGVCSEELAELMYHVYLMVEHRIYRARQINSMLTNEYFTRSKIKVCVPDSDGVAPCGLVDDDLKPVSDILHRINEPICEFLNCSCSFILQRDE